MLINVSIKTLSQGIEAIEKIYINSNIPHFQPLIQFGGSLSSIIRLIATSKITEHFGLFWVGLISHHSPLENSASLMVC